MTSDLMLVIPELFVLGMTCVILVIDPFLRQPQRDLTYWLSQLTLLGAIMLTLGFQGGDTQHAFHGSFVSDDMSMLLKVVILSLTFFAFLYARPYLRERDLFKGEFYVLGLFGVTGMMVMASAASLLSLYLGLELLSLALYAMVALNRNSARASEAAMKYFVLGAIASGMLLYGMSMLYGVSGSLDLTRIGRYAITGAGREDLVLVFGLVFVVVGVAFKLGAVPFHMWLPDVYEGAPTAVTAYLASAPKVAGFAMIIRLLADGLDGLHADWSVMLAILAILSLAIGNIVAIAQANIKRMLAYSAISHGGFLLLGVLSGSPAGYSAAMFYAVTYALMAAGAFGVVVLLSGQGFEADRIEDYKGLARRSPWFAFVMLLLMFSMAGVPPTVGFHAKLAVLSAAIGAGFIWLAVAAVLFSVIGAFYYLRLVKLMYFDEAESDTPITPAADFSAALSTNGILILALGIFPGALMGLCSAAFL